MGSFQIGVKGKERLAAEVSKRNSNWKFEISDGLSRDAARSTAAGVPMIEACERKNTGRSACATKTSQLKHVQVNGTQIWFGYAHHREICATGCGLRPR